MDHTDALTIETLSGFVRGVQEGKLIKFLGLRYAEPPVGKERRWRPPVPLKPWKGIYQADRYGATAPQPVPRTYNPVQSEDCLTLNLWTPGNEGCTRPVLFYIHGGGFIEGSNSNPLFDGSTFAEHGDMVVVTVNYRLGVLGFLDLQAMLGEDYQSSGNCGILDLMEALRWVQGNISRFGGDPSRVTIMGQSAGAKCVAALLSSPRTEGLFHQAIAQSGSLQSIRDKATAAEVAARFMASLNIGSSNSQQLLELSAEQLMAAQSAWWIDYRHVHLFGPVADGTIIPEDPLASMRNRSHLPSSMIGFTLNESAELIHGTPVMRHPSTEALRCMFGDHAGHVHAAYEARSGRSLEEKTDENAWEQTLTDCMYGLAAVRTADAYSSAGAPVWVYRFDRQGPLGAAHSCDQPYVWYHGYPPMERSLADQMHHAWISFICRGTPQLDDLDWEPYHVNRRSVMLFNHPLSRMSVLAFNDVDTLPMQTFRLKPEN